MTLYDFLAPAYDPAFASIYRPFRARALTHLPAMPGAAVLDLACGTGQNFPLLAERVGARGTIIGVDISRGMLRRAARRAARLGLRRVSMLHEDGARLSPEMLRAATGAEQVGAVVCAYGFMAMGDWRAAFEASWNLLAPGGVYLIHDVDGQRRNLHTWAVETVTRCEFARRVWEPLERRCTDFRMDYIEPSAHLFGGRLFVAYGVKARPPRACPF